MGLYVGDSLLGNILKLSGVPSRCTFKDPWGSGAVMARLCDVGFWAGVLACPRESAGARFSLSAGSKAVPAKYEAVCT